MDTSKEFSSDNSSISVSNETHCVDDKLTFQRLQADLEEKERIISVTAELGQKLLEKNQSLEGGIASLLKKLENKEETLSQLSARLDEERERANVAQQREHELSVELESIQQSYENAIKNLNMTASANVNACEDIAKLQQTIKKLSSDLSEAIEAKEKLSAQITGLEEQQVRMQAHTSTLIQQIQQYKRDFQQFELERNKLQVSFDEQLNKSLMLEERFSELEKTNSTRKQQLEDLRSKKFALEKENEVLKETISQLVERNDIQHQQLLMKNSNASEIPVIAMSSEHHDGDLDESQRTNPKSSSVSVKNSLFDELTEELQRELTIQQQQQQQQPEQQLSKSTDDSNLFFMSLPNLSSSNRTLSKGTANDETSPSESHFYLTACAVKINMLVKQSKVFSEEKEIGNSCEKGHETSTIGLLPSINISSLYKKAIREDIPFHEWHSWIKKQFLSAAANLRPNNPLGGTEKSPERPEIKKSKLPIAKNSPKHEADLQAKQPTRSEGKFGRKSPGNSKVSSNNGSSTTSEGRSSWSIRKLFTGGSNLVTTVQHI